MISFPPMLETDTEVRVNPIVYSLILAAAERVLSASDSTRVFGGIALIADPAIPRNQAKILGANGQAVRIVNIKVPA